MSSDVVGACWARTGPGDDHPRGVGVAILCQAAGAAGEDALVQQQAGLGSRTARSARHPGVGGRHHHHRPAGPRATLDQFTLEHPDKLLTEAVVRDVDEGTGLLVGRAGPLRGSPGQDTVLPCSAGPAIRTVIGSSSR